MSTILYRCKDCPGGKLYDDWKKHALESGHTNFETVGVALGTPAPAKVEPSIEAQPLKEYPCPDCGSPMYQHSDFKEQVFCRNCGMPWLKVRVKEQNALQKGKPRSVAPLMGVPTRMGTRQWIGLAIIIGTCAVMGILVVGGFLSMIRIP